MKESSSDVLALLSYAQLFTRAVLESTGHPRRRAARVAETLHELWPSPLSVCLLQSPEGPALSVVDASGKALTRGEALLREEVNGWLHAGRPGEVSTTALPQPLGLADHDLVGTVIAFQESRQGVLALALPRKDRSQGNASARVLLVQAAAHLALLLRVEDLESDRQVPSAESELPGVGGYFPEIAYSVAHEFNNILNNMLLQVAILEQCGKFPELLPSLALIRQMGHNAAAMIRQLQQLSRPITSAVEPIDVNPVVQECVARFRARPEGAAAKVHLDLQPSLPAIDATRKDLAELVVSLLQNAASGCPEGADITVRTLPEGNQIVLRVEDNGPAVPEALLPRLFEPLAVTRPGGGQPWDLTVCKALTRRLGGNIQGGNRAGGGMVLAVQLRAAQA